MKFKILPLPSKKDFMMLKIHFFCIGLILFSANILFAQQKKVKVTCIAFYNCENLYDTIDQAGVDDTEFTPNGPTNFTSERYFHKIHNLSTVISQIGDEFQLGGPVLMGLSEIENANVLNDLINSDIMKPLNYSFVHFDGPDRRGVDVALLYRKEHFVVTNSSSVRLTIAGKPDFLSRDQLVVSGLLDGDLIHIIVNHWPSKRGGEKRSAPLRAAAADLTRHLSDSLNAIYPNAKIVIMGDLNDDPIESSLTKHLKAKSDTLNMVSTDLYNPMYKMYYNQGLGTTAYRDSWNLFDQIIISEGLLNANKGYKFYSAKIFNRPFLLQKDDRFAGYPLRTYVGTTWMGGYSDHFPVYTFLVK